MTSTVYTLTATVTETASGETDSWSQPFTVSSSKTTVGATQGLTSYPSGTTMGQAITQWEGITGMPKVMASKTYYNTNVIPSAFGPSSFNDLPFFVANNIICLLCIKPNYNGSQTGLVQQFLASCQKNGLMADVLLWQEANDPGNSITPTQYTSMWNAYAPVVRNAANVTLADGTVYPYTGYPCCIDFAVDLTAGDNATLGSYFNSSLTANTVDKVYADFYNKDWDQFQLTRSPPGANGRNLTYLAGLCDSPPNGQSNPVAFGIGEFNSNLQGAQNQTPEQSEAFFTYIENFMLTRRNAGKACANVLLFNGAHALGDPLIVDATDPRVSSNNPNFQDVYTKLTGNPA